MIAYNCGLRSGDGWTFKSQVKERMNNCSTRSAVLFVMAILLAVSAMGQIKAEPQTSESIGGRWVGEYHLDGKATYISLTFKVAKDSVSGEMISPLEDNPEHEPFTALSLDGNRIRFQAQPSNGSTIFEGNVEGGWIRGNATRENSSGSFELIHLVRIDPNLFNNYVGDYKTDQGRFIIVGRTLASLYYFDELSGRTGPLLAISETDFFSGPSNGVSYPVDARVNFQKDSGAICRNLQSRWRSRRFGQEGEPLQH